MRFYQCLLVARVTVVRALILERPLDVGDTAVAVADEMAHRFIRPHAVIWADPWYRTGKALVVEHDNGETALIDLAQVGGRLAIDGFGGFCTGETIGVDGKQAVYETGRQNAVDQAATVGAVADAVEHQLVGSLLDHIGDALHDLRHQRPGERRHQHAEQRRAASRQAGCGDAGDEAMLLHDLHHVLACRRVNVGLVIENAGDGSCRDACKVRDIANGELV